MGNLNEDIVKAFQMGIAFGFGQKYDEMDKVIEEIKKAVAPETRWIPVSERLPEVDIDVLVTDNGGGVPTVIIDACGMTDDTGERFWYISQKPIAWMEWPKPYNVESEEV